MHPTPNSVAVPTTRRTFLQHSALAGVAFGFPAVLRAANPNSRVQLAAIGVNARGYGDLHSVASHAKAKFVAFCDIDQANFAAADADHPGTPHFADFRVMLEKLGDTVDAVTVATPDHMHALAAVTAMRRDFRWMIAGIAGGHIVLLIQLVLSR